MTIKDIIEWVVIALIIVALLITTAVTVISKLKAKQAAGETVTASDVLEGIAIVAINAIENTEVAYETLMGNSTGQTGFLKLQTVLSTIKDACESAGYTYDKEYWSSFVNKVVDAMNTQNTTVQSTEQEKIGGVTV